MYSGDKLESKKLKQSQNENDVILTFREKIRQILCKFPLITTSWACSDIEKGIIILFFSNSVNIISVTFDMLF